MKWRLPGQEVDQRKLGDRGKDCQAHEFSREGAVDWIVIDAGSRQGMIDDHDRCEWVNVSSGTDSPELSRTKSREP